MKNLKILFNFATRSRPKKFINVINQLCDKLSDYENCIILVSIDNDDETMHSDEIKNFILNHRCSSIIKVFSSDSKGKIIATNYNIVRHRNPNIQLYVFAYFLKQLQCDFFELS